MQYFASNKWKEKAGGIMVPLILFTDDTSGNRSKKCNTFESWYLLLAGLAVVQMLSQVTYISSQLPIRFLLLTS